MRRRKVEPGIVENIGARGSTFTANLYAAGGRVTKSFGDLEAARVWLDRQRARARATSWSSAGRGTRRLDDAAVEWIGTRPIGHRTAIEYAATYERHIAPTLGRVRLMDLTPGQVRAWHSRLSRTTGRPTVAKSYRLLRAIVATAVRDGDLAANPVDIPGAGAEHSPERPLLAPGDALDVVDGMPERYRLAGLLSAFMGLRRGEVLELRRADVDLLRRTVRVERSASWISPSPGAPRERVVGPPKTLAGQRTLTIPAVLLGLIEGHLTAWCGAEADALLFTNGQGAPVTGDHLSHVWQRAAGAHGLAGTHFHDLRHLSATLAAQSGATTRELMSMIGHSTPGAAMRYQHAAASRQAELADRMGEALSTAERGERGQVMPLRPRADRAQ